MVVVSMMNDRLPLAHHWHGCLFGSFNHISWQLSLRLYVAARIEVDGQRTAWVIERGGSMEWGQ